MCLKEKYGSWILDIPQTCALGLWTTQAQWTNTWLNLILSIGGSDNLYNTFSHLVLTVDKEIKIKIKTKLKFLLLQNNVEILKACARAFDVKYFIAAKMAFNLKVMCTPKDLSTTFTYIFTNNVAMLNTAFTILQFPHVKKAPLCQTKQVSEESPARCVNSYSTKTSFLGMRLYSANRQLSPIVKHTMIYIPKEVGDTEIQLPELPETPTFVHFRVSRSCIHLCSISFQSHVVEALTSKQALTGNRIYMTKPASRRWTHA